MNFLNEVAGEYPSAISFAAGRPTDEFFDRLAPEHLQCALSRFAREITSSGAPRAAATLLQYGRTAGIINHLIAAQLRTDEHVPASAERVLVTSGCQEALSLCIAALCPDAEDVLLVCNPTYIGASGAAHANNVHVRALPGSGLGVVEALHEAIASTSRQGVRARALYLIPEFDNPTGNVLDLVQRRAILDICAEHRIVVLEDNPYGMFRYEGESIPPMASLDRAGSVIYLSTFSKTLSPAMRVGSATLPETLFGDAAASRSLFAELTQRKSFGTVNTSQITQAIVGGLLLQQDCSLRAWVEPIARFYHHNRDVMLSELRAVLPAVSAAIRWNRPAGGFFLSIDLPFEVDARHVTECALAHDVLMMPMAFFALDDSQNRRIRLSFSAVSPDEIRRGVRALGEYMVGRIKNEAHADVAGYA